MRFHLALLLVSLASSALAERQTPINLQRLTVGPFDNHQAAVDTDEKFVYYTRSQNQSSQLMKLDIKAGLSTELTPADADAKSPTLSPDGKTLAFTYYKQDAKGDICLLVKEDITCLTSAGKVEHSPFWIADNRLAYVSSNDEGSQSQLKILNLDTKKSEVIAEGLIFSPSLSPDGRTIVYKAKGNNLVLLDLSSKKVVQSLTMQLPGVTGPARFSRDGAYLYFPQYIVDTNKDLMLDGRDAAAVYRVSLGQAALPEQLTSLDQNCSYPFPATNALYVTCAFEGALDIYRLPLEGTIPKEWSAKDLWDMHQTARSSSDRILYLNHLYTRLKALDESSFAERCLANFLFIDGYQPALYYAKKLLEKPDYPSTARVKSEVLLLETYARWEVLPQKRNLGQFADFLKRQRLQLTTFPANEMTPLVLAYFNFFANQTGEALLGLPRVTSEEPRVLYWKARLERLILREGHQADYRKSLAKHATEKTLSIQSKLYYLSLWFNELPVGADPTPFVADFGQRLEAEPLLKELVDNEQDLYRLAHSADDKTGIQNFRAVVEHVKHLKKEYFPLRLLFNRSLIVLADAKRTRDLTDMVSVWLSHIKKDSKEHPYAVEGMRRNTSDAAYRFFHAKNSDKTFAIGSFYSSVRASDDLESHFQYALLNREPSAWAELEANYQKMVKDDLIRPESLAFVRVVKQLSSMPKDLDVWQDTAKTVSALPDEYIGLGTKYLLLGAIYQHLLTASQKGFAFDRELADQAHRAYLFAIDASFNNDRVMAAALQNLAILHSQLRNYTLAAEFYVKREELPFLDAEEEVAFLWLKAQVMYRSYRPVDALQAMEKALKMPGTPRDAFLEKAAFYAADARLFDRAVEFYQAFFAQGKGPHRAGLYLAYGYALRGAGKTQEAEQQLTEALARADKESAPKDGDGAPALVYQPRKIRFIALGLLARLEGLSPEKRRGYLEQRLALFPRIKDDAKVLHFNEETLSDQEIKETQDLAWLLGPGATDASAARTLEKSLTLTRAHAEKYSYLSATTLISLKNVLIYGQEQKKAWPALDTLVKGLTEACAKEYKEMTNPSPLVTQKWTELRLVYAAYQLRMDAGRKEKFAATASSLMGEEGLVNLAKDSPETAAALNVYRQGIEQSL